MLEPASLIFVTKIRDMNVIKVYHQPNNVNLDVTLK
jgi:hypothetical protein